MSARALRYLAKASPLLLALLCTGTDLYIFRDTPQQVQEGLGVRAACIFRTAVLVLMWRVKLYPTSLQKLGKYMQHFLEFLLAMFVVEYLQADFWLPLESALKKILYKFSKFMVELLLEIPIEDLFLYGEYIRSEWTVCIVTYAVSLFFLISALHGTKAIDMREMKYGPEPFVNAIILAYKKFFELMSSQKAIDNRRKGVTTRNQNKNYCNFDNGHGRSIGWKRHGSIDWPKEMDRESFDDNLSDIDLDG